MMERTAKQNVPDPAASPSTPSVMFTAFDVPTMTSTAKIDPADLPEVDPDGVGPGERQRGRRVGPVHRQLGEDAARTTNCAADLARLLRPRLRRWCTLM